MFWNAVTGSVIGLTVAGVALALTGQERPGGPTRRAQQSALVESAPTKDDQVGS